VPLVTEWIDLTWLAELIPSEGQSLTPKVPEMGSVHGVASNVDSILKPIETLIEQGVRNWFSR
jgi:hypothetical protein